MDIKIISHEIIVRLDFIRIIMVGRVISLKMTTNILGKWEIG